MKRSESKMFYFICRISFILMLMPACATIKAQAINHWETLIMAGDIWHYHIGITEPPSNWAANDFDDSSWLTGPGGIGYGDGDDATFISSVTSVYLRRNFDLVDTSVISMAILNVDFDDGFVAYLNGHEIARVNIGTSGTRPLFNQFALLNIYEAQIPSGGVPARFIINYDTLSKYVIQGGNILSLQVHNCDATSSDLSSATWFSVGIEDNSFNYRTVPGWFNDPSQTTSNLPLLVIDTWGQPIVNEPKIKAWLKVIDNGPGQLNNIIQDGTDYDGFIGIEQRGQSSQMFPKKSFSIETRDSAGTNLSVTLLGMPAEEDWVLYAPYSDKTMLRNAVTFDLGSKMGNWQPGYRFCEVYLNGAYNGVYMLMETIKRNKNRVDINKLNPDEIAGDSLTGGYIIKVDKTWDLTSAEFFSTHPSNTYKNARNYNFTYVYPKSYEIVPGQKTYIYNYLLDLENNLNGSTFKDPVNGFRKYIDLNSFVDFQIMQELTNNVDGYRYSTFFYKKRDSDGGKLYAGPLWDFDLCYGNVDYSDLNLSTSRWLYPNYGTNENYPMHWWARLMEDNGYRDSLAKRWKELREGPFKTDSIMAYIDDNIQNLGVAVDRNFAKWPVLGEYVWPNDFIGATYGQEIGYLKTWITNRLNWMDVNIRYTGVSNALNNKLLVYPNPVNSEMNIRLNLSLENKIDIEIFDLMGKKVFSDKYSPVIPGLQEIKIYIPKRLTGYFILIVRHGEQVIARQSVVINNHE